MVSTKLELKCKDTDGNAINKSIPYVNTSKSNYVLWTFAQALNNLTTNTLNQVMRVDSEDITNAQE